MNEDVKSLWTKALRGGDYKQAQRQLRRGGSYCCLGVLCDIFKKETGEGEWIDDFFKVDGMGSNNFLPIKVQEWAELNLVSELWISKLNDSGVNFSDIATKLEMKEWGTKHEKKDQETLDQEAK